MIDIKRTCNFLFVTGVKTAKQHVRQSVTAECGFIAFHNRAVSYSIRKAVETASCISETINVPFVQQPFGIADFPGRKETKNTNPQNPSSLLFSYHNCVNLPARRAQTGNLLHMRSPKTAHQSLVSGLFYR